MTLVASHLNGARVYLNFSKKVFYIEVPDGNLYQNSLDILENGSYFAISKSNFFSGYVGVATTIGKAKKNLNETLIRVFSRLTESNTFLEYLNKELSFDILPLLPVITTNSDYSVSFREKAQWTPHGI